MWNIINEIIGKTKSTKGSIPTRIIIDDYGTFDHEKRANCFAKFFLESGPKIASIILESEIKFKQYWNSHQPVFGEENLDDDEIKSVLKSVKLMKVLGMIVFLWVDHKILTKNFKFCEIKWCERNIWNIYSLQHMVTNR